MIKVYKELFSGKEKSVLEAAFLEISLNLKDKISKNNDIEFSISERSRGLLEDFISIFDKNLRYLLETNVKDVVFVNVNNDCQKFNENFKVKLNTVLNEKSLARKTMRKANKLSLSFKKKCQIKSNQDINTSTKGGVSVAGASAGAGAGVIGASGGALVGGSAVALEVFGAAAAGSSTAILAGVGGGATLGFLGLGATSGLAIVTLMTGQHYYTKCREKNKIKNQMKKTIKLLYCDKFSKINNLKEYILSDQTPYDKFDFSDILLSELVKKETDNLLEGINCFSVLLGCSKTEILPRKQNIWGDIFKEEINHAMNNFFSLNTQTKKEKAKFQDKGLESKKDLRQVIYESMPEKSLKKLMSEKNFDHLHKNFAKSILRSASKDCRVLECADLSTNLPLTGHYLDGEEKNLMFLCVYFSERAYTDLHTTGKFCKNYNSVTINPYWRSIIDNKIKFKNLLKDFGEIEKNYKNTRTKKALYHHKKSSSGSGIYQLSNENLMKEKETIEYQFKDFIDDVNNALKEIGLNEMEEEYKCLDKINIVGKKLSEYADKFEDSFEWYFTSIMPENGGCKFSYKNNTYYLKEWTAVGYGFLSSLSTFIIESENFALLDVGFRHKDEVKGLFNSLIKAPARIYKSNPAAKIKGNGEVDYITFIDGSNQEKDILFIAFSGSNSARDWVTNISLAEEDVEELRMHSGVAALFSIISKTSLNETMKKLIYYYKKKKRLNKLSNLDIVVTGHSLGGALALVSAYYLKEYYYKALSDILGGGNLTIKVFTFGAPAILTKIAKGEIKKTLGKENVYRVWVPGDKVVSWTNKYKWRHAGVNIPIDNIVGDNDSIFKIWSPHAMGGYVKHVKKLAKLDHRRLKVMESMLNNEEFVNYVHQSRKVNKLIRDGFFEGQL